MTLVFSSLSRVLLISRYLSGYILSRRTRNGPCFILVLNTVKKFPLPFVESLVHRGTWVGYWGYNFHLSDFGSRYWTLRFQSIDLWLSPPFQDYADKYWGRLRDEESLSPILYKTHRNMKFWFCIGWFVSFMFSVSFGWANTRPYYQEQDPSSRPNHILSVRLGVKGINTLPSYWKGSDCVIKQKFISLHYFCTKFFFYDIRLKFP